MRGGQRREEEVGAACPAGLSSFYNFFFLPKISGGWAPRAPLLDLPLFY